MLIPIKFQLMTKKNILSAILLCLIPLILFSQKTISGEVIDENNLPLLGANVIVKDSNKGTVTDFDGKFNLLLDENESELIISYTGFETLNINIENQSFVSVVLKESSTGLDEVVITALGFEAKNDELGSLKEILKYEGDNIPILIGRGMSKYTKLSIGDTFIIRWMDDNRTYDAGLGEIVYVMDSDNFKIDFGHIWLPIEKMQKMLSMENESTYVVFDDNINPHSAGDWIKRDVKYLIRDMETIIEQDRPNAIMIYIILLSLAAMGIFNAQTLSIFRRKKEIGTLMALGMHKRKVVLLFTIEGAMNAIFAIILTVLLFGPLLYYFSIYGVPLPIDYSDMGLIIAKRLIPIYSMPLLIATALIVFLILLLVSYLPSRKISKMHPVDAIRGKTT